MGFKVETIETQMRYEEYVNYIIELQTLLQMNRSIPHINELINSIQVECKIWDNSK